MLLKNSAFRLFPLLAVSALVAGCNSGGGSAGNQAATGNTTEAPADVPAASSTLTIISPHTREIQTEFENLWKAKHGDITLKWLDQGGTSDDLRFVRDQYKARGKETGIGVDLFFGGGGETFTELEKDGLLEPLGKDYKIPEKLNGVPFRGKDNVWVAAALSDFGILYNKSIAMRDKLPVPANWVDLANPKLVDRIQLADPRHSGSAHTAYEIILQTNGWDKGWRLLTAMAGNARSFATNSGAPLESVQNGEAVFCPSIDFYARKQIDKAGGGKLGYIEPKGQLVVTADPIAILKSAPNVAAAKEFVDMVMSPEGQKLWYLRKGTKGGPVTTTLFRLPALPSAYKPIPKDAIVTSDPYTAKNTTPYNSDIATVRRRALDDLIGAVLVDIHDQVRLAWKKNPDLNKTGYVPLSEAEFMKIAPQWDDPEVSNTKKAEWGDAARQHFNG